MSQARFLQMVADGNPPYSSVYVHHPLARNPKMFDSKNPLARSRTKQSDLKGSNIDTIVKKYIKSGQVDPTTVREGYHFQDCLPFADVQASMDLVADIKSEFELLPSELRTRFGNDALACLEFVQNEENADECVKLGLLPKPPEPDALDVPAAAPANESIIDPEAGLSDDE